LIFVNSIKTARRLDGLLRALELNCRALHAQLQQRQRLRALEAYGEDEKGILVATDVAARGLDIAHIHYVITENGIADLYGKTLRQRANELVRIAHPNHQEKIEREYYELLNKS
jgi:superfamily II DNA/RNA helicase